MTEGIFLSYRRDDTASDAQQIHDRLAERFGDDVVFLDIEDIPLGVDFVDAITAALDKSAYVLVAIGPKWLLVTDDDGRKRLDDPHDMVRFEIRLALDGNKRIVPMLIGGADMPSADQLPPEIAALVRRNGISIRPEPDFDMDVRELMSGLRADRIVESRVPRVFRVSLVARNLGFGGSIGWGGAGLLLALFSGSPAAFLALTFSGILSGFTGGAFVGWLTGLLVRHRSPPLVGRKLVRMGFTWSMSLILSAVVSGVIGYFLAFHVMEPSTPSTAGLDFFEALGLIIVGAFVAAIAMVFVMIAVMIVGLITGSAIAAGFFARQFRLRSEQISRGRALLIAVVWLIGGLLTAALFLVVAAQLVPDGGR
jgi:hypothetical protein